MPVVPYSIDASRVTTFPDKHGNLSTFSASVDTKQFHLTQRPSTNDTENSTAISVGVFRCPAQVYTTNRREYRRATVRSGVAKKRHARGESHSAHTLSGHPSSSFSARSARRSGSRSISPLRQDVKLHIVSPSFTCNQHKQSWHAAE